MLYLGVKKSLSSLRLELTAHGEVYQGCVVGAPQGTLTKDFCIFYASFSC